MVLQLLTFPDKQTFTTYKPFNSNLNSGET